MIIVQILIILISLAAIGWMIHYAWKIEPNNIENTSYDVVSDALPTELEGLRLCQVSDVHLTGFPRNADAIAKAIRSVEADLYLFTGDMIHRQAGIPAFLEWLDNLGKHILPAIAVLGNAEHKSHVQNQSLLEGLAHRKIPILTNETLLFLIKDAAIQIVGVDDPHTNHEDFQKAFANTNPSLFTLLLCHSPDGVTELAGHRVDLMLCGHTHGGQIRFPIVGAIAQNTKRVYGLAWGWYRGAELTRKAKCEVGRTQLYVSRGLGMSRLGLRINCRPELTVFTLRRKAPTTS